MTLTDIFDQAKTLSPHERKQLAHMLIDTLEAPDSVKPSETTEHWGQNLLRLLDELGPIDLIYPEIEDPVAWVKRIRQDELQKRLGDWGTEA